MSVGRRRVAGIAAGAGAAYLLFVVAPAAVLLLTLPALFGTTTASCAPADARAPAAGSRQVDDGSQAAYARLITTIVADRGLPQRAAVVAIAAAVQESGLGQAGMNVPVDHDSLGLFQQRPSAGWGTARQVKDPDYATNAFLDRLVDVSRWPSLPLSVAVQSVQRSAFPGAYAKWEPTARRLADRFWPAGLPTSGGRAAPVPGTPPCAAPGGDGVTGAVTDPLVAPPALPRPPGPAEGAAVTAAVAALGRPYRWGADGPDAFDAPGLVCRAWRAAGVALPPTVAGQSRFGAPVADLAAALPGDLVFMVGAGGSPEAPAHVGLYLGDGVVADAPHEGAVVRVVPVSTWAGRITGIRRPGVADPDAPASVRTAAG